MEHVVHGSRVTALSNFVTFLGFDPKRALELAGLPTDINGSVDEQIPAGVYFDLFHAASIVTGMSDFGLRWGGGTDFRKIGPLVTYMQNCASIREAAAESVSFITSRNWGVGCRIIDMGSRSRCDILLSAKGRYPASQFVESAMRTVIPLVREMLGKEWLPLELWFVHQPLSSEDVYREAFGCSVKFGALNNGIVVRTDDLDRPFAGADVRVKTLVGSILRGRDMHDEWQSISACKADVRKMLETRDITINHLATRRGTSPAALQRSLDAVGLSFRDLVTQVRLEIIGEVLMEGEMTPDVMDRLGFSRPNALTRFLKQHEDAIRLVQGDG